MGRRSINTTKSGKFMNPTDQARKEARKRELKKNKKQRQMVRAAVLKGKDPSQIILEMEKLDQMEYNVEVPPALSEKVLRDKRKKLRETLDRVMKMYEKENPEYWTEIRRLEAEYEKKKLAVIRYYESVKHAQAVSVDEIPLPNLEKPNSLNIEIPPPSDIVPTPLTIPNAHLLPAHSILKKQNTFIPPPPPPPLISQPKKPPGCPPTLPPDLSDDEDDNYDKEPGIPGIEEKKSRTIRFADGSDSDEDEKDTRLTISKSKGLTSLQTKLLQMSGQDIDDFMRESEVLFREKEAERKADLKSRIEKIKEGSAGPNLQQPPPDVIGQTKPSHGSFPGHTGISGIPPPGGSVPPGLPPGAPPLMFRPPVPRHGVPPPLGVRLPPGPPPQGIPRMPNMRLPPPVSIRPMVRLPGALAGIPPPQRVLGGFNPNVLSAGPQLITRPADGDKKSSATIEAKPQIRSTALDVTRFLPTALRVKREDKKKGSKYDTKEIGITKAEETDRKPTKDDAYSQFMKEMEDLL